MVYCPLEFLQRSVLIHLIGAVLHVWLKVRFEMGAEDVTNVGQDEAFLQADFKLAEQPFTAVTDGNDVAAMMGIKMKMRIAKST